MHDMWIDLLTPEKKQSIVAFRQLLYLMIFCRLIFDFGISFFLSDC